jgi:hypothetical protein
VPARNYGRFATLFISLLTADVRRIRAKYGYDKHGGVYIEIYHIGTNTDMIRPKTVKYIKLLNFF